MPEPEQVERFTALYQEYHRQVHAYAVTRAGRQAAEDVVAETFVVAWRRLAVIPPGAPLPWLITVARNVVRERLRVEARLRAVADEMRTWVSDAELLTSDVADDVAERVAVLGALSRMSEADREVLTLVAWFGLSPPQAAQVMGCSKATYFVRIHRARRRLQNAMAATGEQALPRPTPTSLVPKESIQ